MIKLSTISRALACSAVAATAAVVMAVPANAHPSITALGCDIGNGIVDCQVFFTGAVQPVTIRWTVDGVPIAAANDSVGMTATCVRNRNVTVSVTVADAFGSSRVSRRSPCGIIP